MQCPASRNETDAEVQIKFPDGRTIKGSKWDYERTVEKCINHSTETLLCLVLKFSAFWSSTPEHEKAALSSLHGCNLEVGPYPASPYPPN